MTDTVGAEIVAGGDLISAAPPPAEAPAQASAPQVASQPAHCPYRRTIDLLQRLAPGKMRIGFYWRGMSARHPSSGRQRNEATDS